MEKSNKMNVRSITIIGVLSSICMALGLTPLGFIPLGVVNATTMHIPVIIGGILEGPFVGGMVGLIFGIFSIIQAITKPTPLSFVFYNPIIAILPRVLIGVVSYYSYAFLKKHIKKTEVSLFVSAVLASLVNTFGVLGGIYIFYAKRYAETLNINFNGVKAAIATVGITNGIPEAIIAGIIVTAVVKAIRYGSRR